MLKKEALLNQLGFSPLAETIYLTLIQDGPLSVTALAQTTGKHRPAIYKAIPELVSANLISKSSKGKRIIYMAESPSVLTIIAKNRLEAINQELPELLSIFQQRDNKLKASVFDGRKGIETVYEQILSTTKKGEAIYRYESPVNYKQNKKYYPSLYWKRAGSKGDVDKFVITNQKTHQQRHARLNRFSKAVGLPFENNITEVIGKDKVVFIDYNTETAILIENERFADFQKTIFKMLFDAL